MSVWNHHDSGQVFWPPSTPFSRSCIPWQRSLEMYLDTHQASVPGRAAVAIQLLL